jgi:hypothetical protein
MKIVVYLFNNLKQRKNEKSEKHQQHQQSRNVKPII